MITFPFNFQPYSTTDISLTNGGSYDVPAGFYGRFIPNVVANGFVSIEGNQYCGPNQIILDKIISQGISGLNPTGNIISLGALAFGECLLNYELSFDNAVSHEIQHYSGTLGSYFALADGQSVFLAPGDYFAYSLTRGSAGAGSMNLRFYLRGINQGHGCLPVWLKSGETISFSDSSGLGFLKGKIELYPNIT